MPQDETAKLYLVTPPVLRLADFSETLGGLLDTFEIACVRLSLASRSEEDLARAADTLRGICHGRDVPIVITDHFLLVERLGLDGVHLSDGGRQVRVARKALGTEAIVGSYAHASRHDGMTAAEIGADYVAFGPISQSSLGDGGLAPLELFEWWSQMIELPIVAEGGIALDQAADLARIADFIALGDELWAHPEGPATALAEFAERIAG